MDDTKNRVKGRSQSQRDRGYTNLLHHISKNDKKQNEADKKIERLLKKIMATEQEALDKLEEIKTNLGKIGSETQTLLDKITALEQAANTAGVPQSVMDKIAEVKGQAQTVDDLVPDAPQSRRHKR